MWKTITSFFLGIVFTLVLAGSYASSLMIKETESPFGLEETVARIQHNIKDTGNWDLVGLRNPSATIRAKGANVPDAVLIEACNSDYSKPLIKDDKTRQVSLMMPCTISVYQKDDGKTYIGTMNAGLMGWMFGPKVGTVMSDVARDQKQFLSFNPSKPAPAIIQPKTAAKKASGGGGGGGLGGGC
jgi:uncharacterized protein (DUF302 family)